MFNAALHPSTLWILFLFSVSIPKFLCSIMGNEILNPEFCISKFKILISISFTQPTDNWGISIISSWALFIIIGDFAKCSEYCLTSESRECLAFNLCPLPSLKKERVLNAYVNFWPTDLPLLIFDIKYFDAFVKFSAELWMAAKNKPRELDAWNFWSKVFIFPNWH